MYTTNILSSGESYIDLWDLPAQADVDINLRILIGFDETDAADIFDTKIITGKEREKYQREAAVLPCDGKVFFYERFDPDKIKEDIKYKIHSCEGTSVESTLNCLRRILDWEFEGM